MTASSAEDFRKIVFLLATEMEQPLNQALSYTGALDLMGFGLRGIHYDYGPSFLAVVETLTNELEAARNTWRKLIVVSGGETDKFKSPTPAPKKPQVKRKVKT